MLIGQNMSYKPPRLLKATRTLKSVDKCKLENISFRTYEELVTAKSSNKLHKPVTTVHAKPTLTIYSNANTCIKPTDTYTQSL